MMIRTIVTAIAILTLPLISESAEQPKPLNLVVMDPLAAPLSCPCVEGYAQRDYEKLAAHLTKKLGRPVNVHFSESLTHALKEKSDGKADIIIGKDSVVRAQAKANKHPVTCVAALTDKKGETTQKGLIVVASADPAFSPSDLQGYRVIFGPDDCDEKHTAALNLLDEFKVELSGKKETCVACSDGASTVLELSKTGGKAATVISSYAQPLLEGCGTIKKGDLRVIGETDPVPFIRAFLDTNLSPTEKQAIRDALLEVGKDATLCKVMETKTGFVAVEEAAKKN